MPRFSGIVRVHNSLAKLETRRGAYTLNPYPQEAAIPVKQARDSSALLFGYLEGQQVEISGALSAGVIFSAHLATNWEPSSDVQIAPESADPFAKSLSLFFKKDSREIATKLNDLGIRTGSAFYHRIRNDFDAELAAFSKYLKVPAEAIREFLDKLNTDVETKGLVAKSPRYPVKRGVSLELLAKFKGIPVSKKPATSAPAFPTQAATPELPSTVDLAEHATPVKDQGMRSTCVAHTAIACLEAEYIRAGKAKPSLNLSEQYLYWACKSVDGSPKTEGTFLEHAVGVLLGGVALPSPLAKLPGGVCTEIQWPYEIVPKAGNESQGPLPDRAKKGLAKGKYRIKSITKVRKNSIKALKETLAAGHSVGLSVYTYHFWTDDFTWREGVISLPLGIGPDGAHAICLVGYKDDDATHKDGYFTFKNSWNKSWGYGRPDPGYGSLPYRYVLNEAIEAYAVDI